MSIRIHELAKRHNMEGKDMLALLKELKFVADDTKSISSTVSKIYEDEFERYIASLTQREATAAESAAQSSASAHASEMSASLSSPHGDTPSAPEPGLEPAALAETLAKLPRRLRVALALRQALRFVPLLASYQHSPDDRNLRNLSQCLAACFAVLRWLASKKSPETILQAISGTWPLLRFLGRSRRIEARFVDAVSEAFGEASSDSLARLLSSPEPLAHQAATRERIIGDIAYCTDAAGLSDDMLDRAALSLFLHPLWSLDSGEKTAGSHEPWANILKHPETGHEELATETLRLLALYKRLSQGLPDWEGILGPEVYRKALPWLPLPPSASLPPDELAILLARLAYAEPSALPLIEAPTRDLLDRSLRAYVATTLKPNAGSAPDRKVSASATALDVRDLGAFAIRLAKEQPDFAPEPSWAAWVQAAHPSFFAIEADGLPPHPEPSDVSQNPIQGRPRKMAGSRSDWEK
jgi:hypothetical protein